MYFLRWLYREVNPMMLILGLVMLYFLLNLATCSNNRNTVDTDTDIVITENAETVSDVGNEVIAQVDENVEGSKEKVAEMTDTEGQQVDSALSKVFKGEQVDADVSEESAEVEISDEATKPSILSRVFKKPTDKEVADATPAAIPEVNEVVAEVVEDASKAGAVVTGTAVAAAGAIAAVVSDESDASTESREVVDAEVALATEVDTPDVDVEEEKKGGFLGLFNRSSKSEEDEVEQVDEVANTEIVTEDAVPEEVVSEEAPVELVAVEDEPVDLVAVEEVVVEEVAVEEAAVEVEPVELVAVEEVPVEVADVEVADVEVAEQTDGAVPPPPSYSANISTNTDGLSAARRAYWDRDYATADSLYSDMIGNEPGNAELIAEYGNMLLQSGQVEKTLDAYETAAGLMIDSGRKLEAKPLIDYISSWDQARADALINKVFAQ